MIGTLRKLKRFFNTPSGRAVILPLDHGASEGMLPGIAHFPALMAHLNTRNMQGVILNKGFARAHALELSSDIPLILQLSAGTRHGVPSWNKALVCSVPEALRLGADAVAVQLNIGNELEDRMLADFGAATEAAHQHGLPVIAVVYAKGERIVQELDPSLITHCIRLGGELGADMVSVPYSGDPKSFARAVASCPVPVLVAGGPGQPDFASFLAMTREALDCGAAGVSVGRNVFQQENPEQALDAILELVHTLPDDDLSNGAMPDDEGADQQTPAGAPAGVSDRAQADIQPDVQADSGIDARAGSDTPSPQSTPSHQDSKPAPVAKGKAKAYASAKLRLDAVDELASEIGTTAPNSMLDATAERTPNEPNVSDMSGENDESSGKPQR